MKGQRASHSESSSEVAADLRGVPDMLRLRGLSLGNPLHLLVATTSTNDEAHRAAKRGAPHGATWVAEEQSAGRGRRGRVWLSTRGEGLLFSVLLRLSCPPSRLPPLSLVVGLAVRDAVASAAPEADVRIKWPNDVLVEGRKVAGVLVESSTAASHVEAVIVGVGINVHTRAFPPSVAGVATSIALFAGSPPPARGKILVDVLEGIERDHRVALLHGLAPLRARIEAADALAGRRVRNESGDEGAATGIDDEGRLVVTRANGSRCAWGAGEVQLAKDPT